MAYLDETGLDALWQDTTKAIAALGLTGVSVGQVAQVRTVDANGVPTSWEAVTVERRLTVTCVTTDEGTVTGQTVTVRDTDASGTVVATAAYDGSPVTFSLPAGFRYHVSVTDAMRMHGAPSTATGVIGAADASVTLTYASLNSVLEKDTGTGRYTNASLSEWWRRQRDGKVYGMSMPKSSALMCTKTRDNAGIADPVPSTLAVTGSDPYATGRCGPYLHYDVNGGTDADGTPYVTAIESVDDAFARDGSNSNVWSMCPVLFKKWTDGADDIEWAVSDTEFTGAELQPGAKLPASGVRPYILYGKYGGGMHDGAYASVSGVETRTRDISHNSLITITESATKGYSGKSVADDWYQKMCWYTKYANKEKQTYMQGCTNYNLSYAVTVAETDVTRVIIAKSNAANLLVGSSVSLGSSDHSNSVFGHGRIASIEDYDASNSAVNIATSTAFTTTTSLKLSTEPWRTGVTDGITYDGSPTSNTSGKEPYVINGIEMAYGFSEILSGVIIGSDGSTGWIPFVAHDTQDDATSLTADYTSCGASLPVDSADSWKYPLYPEEHGSMVYGTTTGGSTTTGLADGHYTNKTETTGTREWPSLGSLVNTRYAGPSCVNASNGLSVAGWNIGGRLSCNGRSRG